MASVFVPVAYVIIVFGGLFIFSYFYRKHTSTRIYEPYFPSHPERNAYVTLLQMTDPPASNALLKSALVRRAMADVQRVLRIREDKPALQNLLQKGSVGDDLWNSLLAAEKELEAEIMEVVAEANSFVEGWGQVIFPTANEMLANEKMRAVFERTNEVKVEIEDKFDLRPKNSASQALSSAATAKPGDALSPPQHGTESIVSSDAEGSSKPGKKIKKRK
ncbi:hypothetical protein K443DRAFT_672228 [Laccaria amethystina LaAM-08-1]|uniref:Translocation protein SEC66 n=1 Tax=Laccaria amethystina LaAM-08-1 TaxID=1095629 RepID=A0A0C9Y446_9AGAR|nr:hypothetical protein K443DRAFT_672228 [Laccaria amethystina LaAM-08-1]